MKIMLTAIAASAMAVAIFLVMTGLVAASAERERELGIIQSSETHQGLHASPMRLVQGNPSGGTVSTSPSVPVRTQGTETNAEGSGGYATGTQSPGTQQGNNSSRNANTKAGGKHK